ncbi:MAG: TylF/MycF family methyltransferase [Gammaproteobacteria bacterium]|nr:TylF/MycF family methyltransferase [Gammaproteobacteria bacterium]
MEIKKYFKLFVSLLSTDSVVRHAAKYELIKWIVNGSGFRVYNKNLIWINDEEFINLKSKFTGSESKQIHERKFNLYNLAKSIQNIQGDTAECGVFKGESSYYILCANLDKNKTHHVFDSFGGLSKPDKVLDVVNDKTAYSWGENDLSISLEVVKENLKLFKNVNYYKGWIPSRFKEIENKEFSFVHIDVDLFQPTYDSLLFFYDRLNQGGIMLCDDYGFSTCPGAKKAFDEVVKDKFENIIHLTTGQGFIIKQ